MRPDYTQWRQRQRDAIKLYERGYRPREIARKLKVSPTSVWRYLGLANVPRLPTARKVPHVWPGRRAPYWELHTRLGACEIVCGRKFCSRCGIWRLISDFPHNSHHGGPLQHCSVCQCVVRSYYQRHATEAQLANQRERHRIYYEGKRRAAGIPVTTAKRRRVVDRVERVLLPVEPLVVELERFDDGNGSLAELARSAGVSERALYRYRYGESQGVRIDVADRLAVAMGKTSSLIWVEVW